MDPLRPISQVLAALARERTTDPRATTAVGERGSGDRRSPADAASVSLPAASLEARLRARLAGPGRKTPHQLAGLFVETVLLSELGDSLGLDPGFSALTTRVTDELLANDEVAHELKELIDSLAAPAA